MTGGRVKRVAKYIGNEPFMLTYGDAVGNIDLKALLEEHKKSKKLGTISVYNFGQSKGVVDVNKDGTINAFREKSNNDGDLINIGYMVMEPQVLDLIQGDDTVFEYGPLQELVKENQLGSYLHKGFWQCMDTMNEKNKLEKLWATGNAPWKTWKD
jgi:glucose-1-phosphate cytidylyltransferase